MLIRFAVLLALLTPATARAATIELVSLSYHIAAAGVFSGTTMQYDLTADTPLVRLDHPTEGSTALSLFTTTDSGVMTDPANHVVPMGSTFTWAHGGAFDAGNAFAEFADAVTALTFRPLVSTATIGTFYGFAAPATTRHGTVTLYDETACLMILTLGSVLTPQASTLLLDTTHLYTLTSSARAGRGVDYDSGAYLLAAPVPDGGSTAALFALGLLAIWWFARRSPCGT